MLIANSLFWCIKNDRELDKFPVLNKISISAKRKWANYSKEKRDEIRKNMSNSRKEYCANCSPEARAKWLAGFKKYMAKHMSKVRKDFWDNASEERKKEIRKKIAKSVSIAMKKKHASLTPDDYMYKAIRESLNKINSGRGYRIEKDVPRINTYCGVVTEEDLKEVIDA